MITGRHFPSWTRREIRMRKIRLALLAIPFTVLAILGVGRPPASPQTAIDVQTVRYSELARRIKDQHGRVVVVDFWADYCAPCKREFPKLVVLHQKYAAGGLAAISVSLDDVADVEAMERVRRFLAAQQASFANYMLNEKPEFWQAKLKIDGPPCVFIFNRRGELVRKFHDDVDYIEIERLVTEALKQE
jgi:thiol-disulfide isomerase/thioredoxin